MKKPIIYDYREYHLFVSDMVIFLKNSDKNFSHRKFSKKAGFASSSFLSSIASGEKGLTPASVQKVAKAFHLTSGETRFFLKLLELKKAKLSTDKKEILEELLSDKKFCARHPLAASQYRYYSSWYYPLVRELIVMG